MLNLLFYIISVRWRNESNATKIQTFNHTQQSNLRIGQIPEDASKQILSHSNSDLHKENKKINKPKRTKQQSLEDTEKESKKINKSKRTKHQSLDDTENTPPKKRYKSEKMPPISVRFDHSNTHFPEIDKSRGVVRCKNGCNKKTYVICSTCKVHLCICIEDDRNCFKDFHMLPKM